MVVPRRIRFGALIGKQIKSYIMEMEIKIAVPETGNIFDAEFSLSIVGMKVKNREALKMLPDKIKQSLIDCVELERNTCLEDKIKQVL
ncbi:hypothetical protein IY41_16545 [Phocaeicola dorei]|jgi:hypothetical protein|uniref:Uncharacterized protein n=4 Tax=Bacteroidaceae TaxID=815 RepID=A0A076IU80_9BACT|nr:MAG: hypothetical protein EL88_11500 [Phocaeicola dorei]RJX03161.1 hypothetical protein DWW74_15420 [Bacteroides sp. AF17-1]DAV09380.1 MAG TPA: hypothetical protein [Caudoviricetes sp.]ALA74900.1 hypothetical protein IY41_16545 [Phocaeicola dorei]RYT93916.1 hypothetical protein EAJ02_14385 [Phocaeicola dorei]